MDPIATSLPRSLHARARRLGVALCALVGLLALAAVGWMFWSGRGDGARLAALSRRGRLAVAGPSLGTMAEDGGTALIPAAEVEGLTAALEGPPEGAVASILVVGGYDGVVVQPAAGGGVSRDTALGHLVEYRALPGLIGAYLAPDLALYAIDHVARMPPRYGEVLAEVARRMLGGERPPRIASFPPLLRKVQHVEVMVLLRSGPRPRLWRSARGSSIARAFLTAVRVAGQRWREREQAMGEPLGDALPGLTVEVSLLRDDGEIGEKQPSFIDRVVSPEHGIAYEHKGSWRYLLPEATAAQGQGSPTRALSQLLSDNGLSPDAYVRADVKVTRLRVESLASSAPSRSAQDALSPEFSADAVIDRAQGP